MSVWWSFLILVALVLFVSWAAISQGQADEDALKNEHNDL